MSLLIQFDLKSSWSGPGGNEDSENLVRWGQGRWTWEATNLFSDGTIDPIAEPNA